MILNKQKKKNYLIRKGFFPMPVERLKRSELGVRYEYPVKLAMHFQIWSSQERDQGVEPLFRNFYEKLTEDQKNEIIITNT